MAMILHLKSVWVIWSENGWAFHKYKRTHQSIHSKVCTRWSVCSTSWTQEHDWDLTHGLFILYGCNHVMIVVLPPLNAATHLEAVLCGKALPPQPSPSPCGRLCPIRIFINECSCLLNLIRGILCRCANKQLSEIIQYYESMLKSNASYSFSPK